MALSRWIVLFLFCLCRPAQAQTPADIRSALVHDRANASPLTPHVQSLKSRALRLNSTARPLNLPTYSLRPGIGTPTQGELGAFVSGSPFPNDISKSRGLTPFELRLLAGATGGWVVGVGTGVLLGYAADPDAGDTFVPYTGGMVIGGMIGSALGPPVGTALAGPSVVAAFLPYTVLATGAVQVAGIAVTRGLHRAGRYTAGDIVFLAITPVVQITISYVAARLASRSAGR